MDRHPDAREWLAGDLRQLRVAAGFPSLRELQHRTGGRVSKTTIARMLDGALLPKLEQLIAVVVACGGNEREWRMRWEHAFRSDRQGYDVAAHLRAAVARLHSDDLDERLVGIRIMQQELRNPTDNHWQLVNVLEDFVRSRVRFPAEHSPTGGEARAASESVSQDVGCALEALAYRTRVWEPRRLDLGSADLQGIRMPRAWFPHANLANSSLQDADLLEAHLEGADLTGAQIQRANLRRAHLADAILRDAQLQHARLTKSDLRQAIFTGANLRYARLDAAQVTDANFDGADLFQADLVGVVGLTYSQVQGANIDGAKLPIGFGQK